MEIYKLSDEIPEKKSVNLTKKHKYDRIGVEASRDVGVSDGGGLKITDIKQAVRNENRVNVYVNDKYAFALDVAQVVGLRLKIGKVITADELAEYKKAGEFGKAYQRALEWVLVRPRSVKELKDYLRRRDQLAEAKVRKDEWQKDKEIAEMIARGEDEKAEKAQKRREKVKPRVKYEFDELIVERLCEKGYVDDVRFAEYYVENRFIKMGISRKRLKMELMKKGVEAEIVEQVMDGRNDEEEILKIIAKKRAKYDDEKLIQYLCRQGFSYQLARNLVRTYEKD